MLEGNYNMDCEDQLRIHGPQMLQYKDILTMFPLSWHILNDCKAAINYQRILLPKE